MSVTHVGYSDESNWNVGRFRSLALVTTKVDTASILEKQLAELLRESDVREFKWKKLKDAKMRFAALKIIDLIVRSAKSGQLRVDVLVWDTEDSRHKIPGRDDIANLQRMYYHLFRNVLRLRWPDDAVWRLYPDENTAMDWDEVQDFLDMASITFVPSKPLTRPFFKGRLKKEFSIEQIVSVKSEDHPLLQVADLFAGIAIFSRENYRKYKEWERSRTPTLFDDEQEQKWSRREIERFTVISELDRLCKKKKLGVSLNKKSGFWTPNPVNPINFWLYEPQHSADKAPRRNKR